MFTISEWQTIQNALQRIPGEPYELLGKIEKVVNRTTLLSIGMCVRPKDKLRDVKSGDRMVVFETERELVTRIREIARKGGPCRVAVEVPNRGLYEAVFVLLAEALQEFGIKRLEVGGRRLQTKDGLDVYVVHNVGNSGFSGWTVDWAFFYNEVAGF